LQNREHIDIVTGINAVLGKNDFVGLLIEGDRKENGGE
jgi:hypothetical protein